MPTPPKTQAELLREAVDKKEQKKSYPQDQGTTEILEIFQKEQQERAKMPPAEKFRQEVYLTKLLADGRKPTHPFQSSKQRQDQISSNANKLLKASNSIQR